ncbi:Rieske domain-containing protein-like isoform 3-T5 [Menidia menidia]
MSMSFDEEISQTSSSTSSPPPSSFSPTLCFIGKKEDIVRAGRVTKSVNGCRDVLVLHHRGQLYAMDMRCYHSGGALQNGDIEYKITLAEGECLYQAVDNPTAKPVRTQWRSKGVKQRIHEVTEISGDVYVTLNDSTENIDSDFYQTEKYRTVAQKTQQKPTSQK